MALSKGGIAAIVIVAAIIVALGLGLGLGLGLKNMMTPKKLAAKYPCQLNSVTVNPAVETNPLNTTQIFNRVVAITLTNNSGTFILQTGTANIVTFEAAPDLSDLNALPLENLFVLRPKVYGVNTGQIAGQDYFGLQSLSAWNNKLVSNSQNTVADAQQSYIGVGPVTSTGNFVPVTATYWNPGFGSAALPSDLSNVTFAKQTDVESQMVVRTLTSDTRALRQVPVGDVGLIVIHFIDNNVNAAKVPGVADLCSQATSCVPVGAFVGSCPNKL